jgi:hypothetical protein
MVAEMVCFRNHFFKDWNEKMNYKKLIIRITFLIFALAIYCIGQQTDLQVKNSAKVSFAGVRSSSYGIRPFPDADDWTKAMQKMSTYFEGSRPCAIWIVGELSKEQGCRLFFPANGNKVDNVIFKEEDIHEPYLTHFDKVGIKVFLQVEPGNASVDTLIALVLNRYKHHSSVIGFGIDVEWFRESERKGWGIPVTDSLARNWEKKVKKYNPDYKLFLKHWDRDWMPPTYRGDIIFISDSQEVVSLSAMVDEFTNYWAGYFKPNPVYFQIGYRSDRVWWNDLNTPPKAIGEAIIANIDQETGIFWVDFTLRETLLSAADDTQK